MLIDHGDEVIIPVPYWVSFKDMVEFCGGKCAFVATHAEEGFRLTAAMIEKAITPRTRIILLNSPNNPSGAVVAPEDLTAIVKLAAARGIYVMSDECYVYLDYTGRPFSLGSLTEYKDSLLLMGSLSKTYSMTGWRLGFALAPKAVIGQLQKLQSQSTSNPTSIVQKAGLAAVTASQQCVAEMRAEYIQLRDRIVAGLRTIPGVKVNLPEGAFYAFPDVSEIAARAGHQHHGADFAAVARRPRGRCSRRGVRNTGPHSVLLRDLRGRNRPRVGAGAYFLRLSVDSIAGGVSRRPASRSSAIPIQIC